MAPRSADQITRYPVTRRLAVGAEVQADGSVHFRVWAPDHVRVLVILEDAGRESRGEHPLESERNGYFSGTVASARPGSRYFYRLDEETQLFADPASRFQPDGPHGASVVVDPRAFTWTDEAWRGAPLQGRVFYELHVGTFTREGTWAAAGDHLADLASLGVTTIEVMPVAEFSGSFGWGYDGVNLYAPTHLYGQPDDFRRFVDRAHRLDLGVVLDVVYNHLGPDGNFLDRFARRYFSAQRVTEWGAALNFDEDAAPVREFVAGNAAYWIDEFHLDGLRFDATQQIFDDSSEHILAEAVRVARAAAPDRTLVFVAENEPQHTRLVKSPARGGYGLDALWNDDFHHAARVRVSGRREAYCSDYTGTPQEFLSLAKWGFLYQGQYYAWQKKPRGTPSFGIAPQQFVTFLENHDQVANAPSGRGERLHQTCDPAMHRAMTALWLLMPGTPMFFQGQEFGSSAPFVYFADHRGELARAVRTGRAEFMRQFPSLATRDLDAVLSDPADRSTFERCVLSDAERKQQAALRALHRDLLQLRRTDRVFQATDGRADGAVLGTDAFVLRFFSANPDDADGASASFGDDRLLIVNFGIDLLASSLAEPLLAPPLDSTWVLRWSSEDGAYGGSGTPRILSERGWLLPGRAALVLAPRSR